MGVGIDGRKYPAQRWVRGFSLVLGGWAVLSSTQGLAAETTFSRPNTKTLIVLKLDTSTAVSIRTHLTDSPRTIEVEFPDRQIVGSLPEHATMHKGVVQAIDTRYEGTVGSRSRRFIQAIRIVLSGPYVSFVRSEPGRIVVEIDHPSSVASTAMEIGLGMNVFPHPQQAWISERFRAMQQALVDATTSTVVWKMAGNVWPEPSSMPRSNRSDTLSSAVSALPTDRLPFPAPKESSRLPRPSIMWFTGLGLLGVIGLGSVGTRWLITRWLGHKRSVSRIIPPASSLALIDQLVWRSFERQGYQLVKVIDLTEPSGILRVIISNGTPGTQAAVLCVGNGVFFEKQIVDQFLKVMRAMRLEQGILVAAGSFTIPAQRFAKDHQITLVGRDPLIEILSAGATSEYFGKQIEQVQRQLMEAQETLRQYGEELEVMRRQRNEASWYLGEERAKSASVEAQIDALTQQFQQQQGEITRWQKEATELRKRWEESQWYLGESRAYSQHLENQYTSFQILVKQNESAAQQREEAQWYLGEERLKRQQMEQQLVHLQEALATAEGQKQDREEVLKQVSQELMAIRAFGERRQASRVIVSEAFVELDSELGDHTVYAGCPRDMSLTGLGLETDEPIPTGSSLRVRIRLPGFLEPVESQLQVQWQQAEGDSAKYRSGCRFCDLPPVVRTHLEGLLGRSP